MRARALTILSAVLVTPLASAAEPVDLEVVHRIRAEALQRSQVMDHLGHLADVIGPRLPGSPAYMKAAEWSVGRVREWGITSAGLESWGPFGHGWSYRRLAVHMLEPTEVPLIGVPEAWCAGTAGPVSAEVVLAPLFESEPADDEHDLEKLALRIRDYAAEHAGKLRGKIVLLNPEREFEPAITAPARRHEDEDLKSLFEAPEPPYQGVTEWPMLSVPADREERNRVRGYTPRPIQSDYYANRRRIRDRLNSFLRDEGVVAVLSVDRRGDGGHIFVEEAGSWLPGAPLPPASIRLMPEHYNRLVRLVKRDRRVKVEVELDATLHDAADGVNVIAELPGGAKKNEIVMMGAHLDSWHAGTGAGDNAAGSAVMLEALRILKALDLDMERTVRLALWGSEEVGHFGSDGYVAKHFGDPVTMRLKPEHERLAAYFNYDNGSGRIRGVYLQGNDMVRPIFEAWLAPFRDLGADTLSIRNTGGTDHQEFDAVGLPAFQFIQDPLDYMSRTHHSDMDTYDHVEPGDLMQAAAIVAAFVYHTATRDGMLPRKPLPAPLPPKKELPESLR
ncbi:MAG TPA: M20/M25/M40 family metallo-hydrolase [Candidatus Polarisedimenticolia bacterium]|nr:M20/M25/M40 family metallo-hydrolase [Candidatus Polarisedimenticolia bacterium]